MTLAALLLPFVVALPPGAVAPPPGSVPAAARVTTLDRGLGLVYVRLPRHGVAASVRRLRAAPGVRYVERDAAGQLAAGGAGCETLTTGTAPDPGWRSAIHLSKRSAAGMLIGVADSGVDDDRLAPRQAPFLYVGTHSKATTRDDLGHGTAVASVLVANRPDVGIVGLVPDATLLSARIVRPDVCSSAVLANGLIAALGWLRKEGAQVVNVSATTPPSRALVESLRALELSGSLVVAAVGNGGRIAGRDLFPASQPGVLGVGALAPSSSAKVWTGSTSGSQVDLVAPAAGIKVLSSRPTSEYVYTPSGTSFATPLVTAAAAMVWATHRDWNAAEVANALVRSATPLAGKAPSRSWGSGRLNVSLALRTVRMPDPHEPNDWGAAAVAQRPLRPGAVVVASLGYAGDAVDAYPVVVPVGRRTRARLRHGARGLTMRVLPFRASDAAIAAVAGARSRGASISLPPGRHLLVVARSAGAGPYTLKLSRR